MSLILIVSIIIRLIATGLSIVLLRRMRDWRMGFLTVMLGLMALRQILTLLKEKISWAISFTAQTTELPGLAVSIMVLLAVFFFGQFISMREQQEKIRNKDRLIALPWQIDFFIGTVGLIVVIMVGLSFYTGIRMNTIYAPLIDASKEIKYEATTAHLWFEEIITGDKNEDIRTVWENLDNAAWYAQVMLEGGENNEGTYIPLDDAEMRQIIRDVQKNLKEFRDITHQRLVSKKTAGIGTEIDQRYDAVFMTFINQADKIETRLQQIMAQDFHSFQLLQIILIITGIILTLIIGVVFHRYNQRLAEDFLTIDKVNKDLEKEVVERKQAVKQILRQSTVSKAINRVLQETLMCNTEEEVAQICLSVAQELTNSKFGFIGEVNESGRFDTIALSDPSWEACRMPKSDATRMIKNMGIRGIWSQVLKYEKPLLVNDPASHPERVGTPEGHPPLTSFLGVPLKHAGRTIGMFALANKESGYDLDDQQDVETLSVAFVEALMRKRAEYQIQHLQRVLMAIRDVNQLIVHEKNQKKLLQGACDILNQTRDYKLVWIGLVREDSIEVTPMAQAGFEEGYLKSIKITWDDSETGKGPTGTAIRTGKPSVMRNIAGESQFKPWRKAALKRGYASSVAVPLIHIDKVWGALNVYATTPNSFDDEEIELLLEVGQDIAFALHTIELEEEQKQAEKELLKRRDENIKLTVIAKERGELQEWINTFDTFVGKFDPDGRGLTFNDAPIKAAGLTKSDVVGKYFPDTTWWSHSETERARIVKCFEEAKNGTSSRIETSFRSADGTPVPIIFNCQPVIDDKGKIVYITAEGKIITKEVKLREVLQKEKESLEKRVEERTSELVAVNEKLRGEIDERNRAEEQLKKSYEQLRNLSTHLQSIREEERTQIAREIHDELGQILTVLKIDLSLLGKKVPKDKKSLIKKITSMSELIDSTIQTVKRISTELRPGLLDDLGLSTAIEWQAEEFQNRTGIKCEVTIDPDNIIPDRDRSTAIFRICQEALTNIARHAEATKVMISLKEKSDSISLIVKDNGIGIAKEQITKTGSFGILGMQERIYPWDGDFDITGIKSKGTTVTVNIPLYNKR